MPYPKIEINKQTGGTYINDKPVGNQKWTGEVEATFTIRKEITVNAHSSEDFQAKAEAVMERQVPNGVDMDSFYVEWDLPEAEFNHG